MLVPGSYRQALGIGGGGPVLVHFENGELRMMGRDAAIARAQALVAKHLPKDVSLVDALLAERRREVESESRDA